MQKTTNWKFKVDRCHGILTFNAKK